MVKELNLRQLLPFRKPPTCRDSDRKYLEGDWQLSIIRAELPEVLFTTNGTEESNYEYSGDGDGRSVNSYSTYSTNATMDNNIGPGRMLDKLYQYLGRRVEWAILRISISSLHPNTIMHGLLSPDELVIEYYDSNSDSDDDDNMLPTSREAMLPITMTDVIAEFDEHHKSETISGLKSLVNQTQSKSLYQSAAALAAFIHLTFLESSGSVLDFLCIVASREPIFQLETQAMALDDSHPDKWFFLSLVSMARLLPDFVNKYSGNREFKTVNCLRQDLIELMQVDRTIHHGALYSLTKSLSLVFDILITASAIREDAQDSTIECLTQTTYFLILFFLQVLHLDHVLYYSNGTQQLANSITSYCTIYFAGTVRTIFRLLSAKGHYILSPFKIYKERNPGANTVLLKDVYTRLDSWPYDGSSLDSRYLPRNYQGKGWSPYTIVSRISMSISRQLFSFSLDELKQEFLRNKYRNLHFKMFLRDGLLDLLQYEWSLENLRQTHERARKVEILENDLTREFIEARRHPHETDEWLEKENFENWRLYKIYCNRRRVWGECVRSDMDWDWDSGSCLTNLFTIKDATENTVREATTASQLYGYGSQGETAQMALEDARATLPKQIQVRYEDRKGRIRYKTYMTSPSTESITSSLSAPLTCPTVDSNQKEEAKEADDADDADGPSIYESALEFPLD